MDKERTKREILDAFIGMADVPFERATVTQICERAQVSRQTFYHYFRDKYDVAAYLVRHVLQENFKQLGTTIGWREAYCNTFLQMERYASVLRNVGEETDDYNSLKNFTIRAACEDFTDRYRDRHGHDPSPLIAFQIHWLAVLGEEVPRKWLEDGCVPPARELADLFVTLIPRELFEALDVS